VKKDRQSCWRLHVYLKQVALSRQLKGFIRLCICRSTFVHDVSIATFVFNSLFCWLFPFLIKIPEGNKEFIIALILWEATQWYCLRDECGGIEANDAEFARKWGVCRVDNIAIVADWIHVHISQAEEVLIQKGVSHYASVGDLAPNIKSRNCTSEGISVIFWSYSLEQIAEPAKVYILFVLLPLQPLKTWECHGCCFFLVCDTVPHLEHDCCLC